jgi:hypothetical protein
VQVDPYFVLRREEGGREGGRKRGRKRGRKKARGENKCLTDETIRRFED